jgi:ParB family chromosome partitioning protein
MLQPPLVRRVNGRYQLIAGERRLRAAIKAGWTEIPVHVREADDRQMAELAIVENLQRKDLNPLEKAASFDRYLEQYQCTQEELASRLSIDRSTIANLIRLLELPAAVQDAIRSGAVSQGHARALLPLGDEREQVAFCDRIKKEGLSVRAVEQLVQDQVHSTEGAQATASKSSRSRSRNQNLAALEQEFRQALGAKVAIRESAKGRGRIVIQFSTAEEFDRLRTYLLGHPLPLGKTG